MEDRMKVSRKKFFISLSAVLITGVSVFSNPMKLLGEKRSKGTRIIIKENPNAVKRNSTGAVNG